MQGDGLKFAGAGAGYKFHKRAPLTGGFDRGGASGWRGRPDAQQNNFITPGMALSPPGSEQVDDTVWTRHY